LQLNHPPSYRPFLPPLSCISKKDEPFAQWFFFYSARRISCGAGVSWNRRVEGIGEVIDDSRLCSSSRGLLRNGATLSIGDFGAESEAIELNDSFCLLINRI
jgi:hypothetical protein